jgi:hypothetical protein
LLIAFPIARGADAIAERGAMTSERVQHLPAKSLVVPGHFCPHARLGAKVAKRSDLEFVCPGWAWPADLSAVLNRALTDGRPVAVDRASDAWVGDRETQPRKEVSDWFSGLQSTEVEGFTVVVR